MIWNFIYISFMWTIIEICELPDEDEDDGKEDANGQLTSDVLHNKLKESVKDMGIQVQFDAIIS